MKQISLSLAMVMLMVIGVGCATSSSNSANLDGTSDVIEQSKATPQSEACKKIGELFVTARTKDALMKKMRAKAIRKGANHVEVISMFSGKVSGKLKASGIAMICPSGKLSMHPERSSSESRVAVNSARPSSFASNQGQMRSSDGFEVPRTAPSEVNPAELVDDGNPFQ